jgi:hypothetical protein
VQLGHDVETIIGSAYPSFGFGGRKLSSAFCNSIVLHIGLDIIYLAFVCYLYHQFFNQQRFRADGILIPVLRQALYVVGNPTRNFKYNKFVV